MDERPNDRFWIAVAAVMILLTLVDLAIFGLVIGEAVNRAVIFIFGLAPFLGGLFVGAWIILFTVGIIGRRDDPRCAKRPADNP